LRPGDQRAKNDLTKHLLTCPAVSVIGSVAIEFPDRYVAAVLLEVIFILLSAFHSRPQGLKALFVL